MFFDRELAESCITDYLRQLKISEEYFLRFGKTRTPIVPEAFLEKGNFTEKDFKNPELKERALELLAFWHLFFETREGPLVDEAIDYVRNNRKGPYIKKLLDIYHKYGGEKYRSPEIDVWAKFDPARDSLEVLRAGLKKAAEKELAILKEIEVAIYDVAQLGHLYEIKKELLEMPDKEIETAKAMRAIAEGDLNARIPGRDI